MQIWRFRTSRSVRRSADRALRRARSETRVRVWQRRAAIAGRSADVVPPLLVSVALHAACVIFLVGHAEPQWLSTAWQVSASLVGLGVALVIFLLQAAAGQSVASRSTYRAMVGATGLIWPATMALTFIVAVAFVERWGGSTPPATWADTAMLAVFVVQILSFGVAFVRTLTVVTPGGVAEVIERAFADLVHKAVERRLRRNEMHSMWAEACSAAGVEHVGLFARGRPVVAGRVGRVDDLDLRLPRAIAERRLEGKVTLTVDVGDDVTKNTILARLTVTGRDAERIIRASIKIGRRRDESEPSDVFEDVMDLCRRELQDGSNRSMRRTWRLVVDTLAGLPGVYARWDLGGAGSAAAVRQTEIELLGSLRDFNTEVLNSHNADAVLVLPEVAAELVAVGLDVRGPEAKGSTLVVEACGLWLQCLAGALRLADDALGRRLRDKIGQLGYQAVLVEQGHLEDVDLPRAERTAVIPGLEQLFNYQLAAMRLCVDSNSAEGFVSLWSHWVAWARHWEPEHDVDDLEIQVLAGPVEAQRVAERQLALARELVEVKQRLRRLRRDGMFVLGAWAFRSWQDGRLSEETWAGIAEYLVGAVPETDVAIGYATLRAGSELQSQLESWQLSRWDGRSAWMPPDAYTMARSWAIVLLLKHIDLDSEVQWNLGDHAPEFAEQLRAGIARIEADPGGWTSVVGPDLLRRATAVRDALDRSAAKARETAEQSVREAPIDSARVALYTEVQGRAYARADILRPLLLRGNGILIAEPKGPVLPDRIDHIVYPKRPFTALGDAAPEFADDAPGRHVGKREMARLYEAVSQRAVVKSSDETELRAVDLAVEAIADLRGKGSEPDAVLIPHDVYLRALLSGHPEWSWAHAPVGGSPQHLATLSGVPVYDIAPREATWLVVARIAGVVQRVERRTAGDPFPLSVNVVPINDDLAGQISLGEDSKGSTLEAVRERYVEVQLSLDVEYRDSPKQSNAALRVEVPPPGKRRESVRALRNVERPPEEP